MSGAERQEALQRDEAMLWLARAEDDLAGARLLLAGEAHDLAAFHTQQAVEKLLKALLVAAAQDVRRTHDIETLAVPARAHWPDIVPSPFPLVCVNQWYVTTRYPGIDDVSPSAAEVADALKSVEALIGNIHAQARPSSC